MCVPGRQENDNHHCRKKGEVSDPHPEGQPSGERAWVPPLLCGNAGNHQGSEKERRALNRLVRTNDY